MTVSRLCPECVHRRSGDRLPLVSYSQAHSMVGLAVYRKASDGAASPWDSSAKCAGAQVRPQKDRPTALWPGSRARSIRGQIATLSSDTIRILTQDIQHLRLDCRAAGSASPVRRSA